MKRKLKFFSLLPLSQVSQKGLMKISDFREIAGDTTANTSHPETTPDGKTCALIKVQTVVPPSELTLTVGESDIVKAILHDEEIWIYLRPNTPSLTIRRNGSHSVDFTFPTPLLGGCTYNLELDTYTCLESAEPVPVSTSIDNALDTSVVEIQMQYLILECEAADATVCIDGTNETEPFVKQRYQKRLPIGLHQYKVEAPRYFPLIEQFELFTDVAHRDTVQLNPTFATITILTEGGATLYVDGQAKGTGSWQGELSAGMHNFEARKESYETATLNHIVHEGENETIIVAEPRPLYGKLDISSSEIDAHIFIDNIEQGLTPAIINNVLIGNRSVTLKKQGYEDKTTHVMVTENRTATVSLKLKEEHWRPIESAQADKYRKLATNGDPLAQYDLGLCYFTGRGVSQSYSEAIKWFRLSAEQNVSQAQFNLGLCYYYGHGLAVDKAIAVKWFRMSAEQGNATAQNNLGECYYYGNGMEPDFEQAFRWFRMSAEQGNAYGQNKLGECYYFGNGTPHNYSEAAQWFRKAAEQGFPQAQNNMGTCFMKGLGVDKDTHEATNWFIKSADHGNREAQCLLGEYYWNNENYEAAELWYRKAAEQGDLEAMRQLQKILDMNVPV